MIKTITVTKYEMTKIHIWKKKQDVNSCDGAIMEMRSSDRVFILLEIYIWGQA